MHLFKIVILPSRKPIYWFLVKDKYHVRINVETGKTSCECEGFCWGVKHNRECKHIRECKRLLEVTGRLKP